MFQTHLMRTGKNGSYDHKGRLWETGGGFPVSEEIYYGRSKKAAIAAADAAQMRAVVTPAHCAEILHDNGKEPGRRERPYAGPIAA